MEQLPNTPKTTAAYTTAKQGILVPRSTATYILQNFWDLGSNRDLIETYYLLRWTPDMFQSFIREGTIKRAGVSYQIIYYRADSTEVLPANCASVLLSFRSLLPCYEVSPVVLVTSSDKPVPTAKHGHDIPKETWLPYTEQQETELI